MEEGEPRVPKTRINEMLARCDAAKAGAAALATGAAALAPGAAAQAAAAQVGVSMVVRTRDGSEVDLDAWSQGSEVDLDAAQEFAQEFEFMTGRP